MMTPERWTRIDDVFHQVLDLSPSERETLLASTDDDDLRDEVRRLLTAHEATGPLRRDTGDRERPPALEWIGPYRLIRKLGEGGMGVVHLAERTGDGFTQVVALKLIRAGFATTGLETRLAEERRILARLDHPGIARFIDGGSTASGQPYVAIEYIEGTDLLQFCTDRALPLRRRLALFADVCDAVHYAHQQLVVHRDLKPGNILVTNDGRPKLLDFGLAKVLEEDGPGDATQTAPWVTPAYASPEQMRRGRISTLTDIYALGVVLYELLTGSRPHDLADLTPAEMVRAVCDDIPSPPSAAVRDATSFGTSPERLRRRIEGDLDVIVLKTLAKEPERRYRSACELAEDIRRYLDGRPVLARRDRFWYRAAKFAVRHRAGVAVAAIVMMSLTVGLGVALWQARAAGVARDRAEEAKRQSEDVTSFLLGLLSASDPTTALGDTLAAREILRRGAAEAERLTAQPELQARMFDALGVIYDKLGRYDDAERLLARSLTLRRATLGDMHADVALSLEHLGNHYRDGAAYARAEALYREALGMRQRLVGPEHSTIAETLGLLAYLMPYMGKSEEAEEYFRRAVDMGRRTLPPNDDRVSAMSIQLGSTLARLGKYDESEVVFREAIAMRRTLHGADHPSTADAQIFLGDLLSRFLGRYAEAESLYRRALDVQRRAYGDHHLQLIHGISSLSETVEAQGKMEEAERLIREGFAIRRGALGPRHSGVVESLASLAGFFHRRKRYAEAEALQRQVITMAQAAVGAEHGLVAGQIAALGFQLTELGRYAEADSMFLKAIAMREKLSGPRHGHIATWLVGRAHMLTLTKRYPEAEVALQRALDINQPILTDAHPEMQRVLRGFVELYRAWRRPEEAARYAQRLHPVVAGSR